jgi:hypothetical protein
MVMAQTFDIRFARSAGLAALLEAPGNRYRWKGGGLLSIDAQSISFTVKRSLLELFSRNRTQRIPAENLREVYREGEALRVEFQTEEIARAVLPFWVDDRDVAARIVRLLPTSHTVELEHSTSATQSAPPRADWRVLGSLFAVLALIAALAWALYQGTQAPIAASALPAPAAAVPLPSAATPSPGAATPEVPDADAASIEVEAPAATLPASAGSPLLDSSRFIEPDPLVLTPPGPLPLPRDYVRSEDFVIPIPRSTPAYAVAQREVAVFEREAAALESDYRNARDLLTAGGFSTEEFATRLDQLEMRWWEVTFRIFDNDGLADPVLLDLRAAMLGGARLWRGFLSTYAAGLRKRDHVMIASAFDLLARAQELQSRARLFLR